MDEGIELIDRALAMQPDSWVFLDTKGWGLHKQGHHKEALVLMKRSWAQKPIYNHDTYLNIKEVEQAVANQI